MEEELKSCTGVLLRADLTGHGHSSHSANYSKKEKYIILPSISRSGNEKLGPSKPKLPRKEKNIQFSYTGCLNAKRDVLNTY